MQTRHWNQRLAAPLSTLAVVVITFPAGTAKTQSATYATVTAKRNALAQSMLEELT